MEKINVLSTELQKIVNNARPKKGQVIYFESLRPQGGGTSVRSVDRIYDPWADNEDGSKGAHIDIGYVLGQLPAMGNQPARHNFGRIQYSKSSGNIISISSNNRGDDSLFQYLFLTNYNKMNIGKQWYAPGEGQMPLFTQQQPAMTAKDANDYRRRVMLAFDKIEKMPNSKLLDFAISLDMRGINEFSDMEEVRNKLFLIAEGDPKKGIKGNPDRVLNMDKDINLNMKLFIKEALKYNIWSENRALGLFVWSDTKEPVFTMTPGQDMYAEAIKYLLGEGERTHSLVSNLLDKAKAKEKAKDKETGGKKIIDSRGKKATSVGDAIEEAANLGDNSGEKITIASQVVEVKD